MTIPSPDLYGTLAPPFLILERAGRDKRSRTYYYAVCLGCGHEQVVRAQSVRRALEGKEELRCKGCRPS